MSLVVAHVEHPARTCFPTGARGWRFRAAASAGWVTEATGRKRPPSPARESGQPIREPEERPRNPCVPGSRRRTLLTTRRFEREWYVIAEGEGAIQPRSAPTAPSTRQAPSGSPSVLFHRSRRWKMNPGPMRCALPARISFFVLIKAISTRKFVAILLHRALGAGNGTARGA